ncbi:hypothetical protein Gasu2_58640 [Galdieria sulphuraria]|nr:hypothetical protein Gasu2_58640 [Galdieria sulphuraria]
MRDGTRPQLAQTTSIVTKNNTHELSQLRFQAKPFFKSSEFFQSQLRTEASLYLARCVTMNKAFSKRTDLSGSFLLYKNRSSST